MTETSRYLEEMEKNIYKQIETRKKVASWLVFGVCQSGSVSFSIWLLQTTANLTVALTGSAFLALLPGVMDLTGEILVDGKNSSIKTELKPVLKIMGGLGFFVVSNHRHWEAYKTTRDGIQLTYEQIRPSSPWIESLPTVFTVGVAAVLGLAGILAAGGRKRA